MGGQLSSSSPASSITSASSPSASSSNSLSPSPGLSSLGSNGQQSARCRSSSPPTQSASQSSLASSSIFSANSIGVGGGPIGRHSSAALIRPLGNTAIHSPPLPPPSGIGPSPNFGSGGQSRFLISPPMFRRNNQAKNGEVKALSRWGSFTKALPSLVRGNSSAGNHHTKNAGKENKRHQINHHLGGNGNGNVGIGLIRKVGMVDPNNNTKSGKWGCLGISPKRLLEKFNRTMFFLVFACLKFTKSDNSNYSSINSPSSIRSPSLCLFCDNIMKKKKVKI
jgi:hypothetical protein